MSNPEWLQPSKILEDYIPSGATNRDIVEVEKKLYLAVTKGDVHACFQGAILDPRWFMSQTFDDHNPYALPPDVKLSVEDVKREFGRS